MTYLVKGMSKKAVSQIQKERHSNGTKWEKRLLSLTSDNRWKKVDTPEEYAPDIELIKTWKNDLVHHVYKIFIEAATSPKYEKVSNIRLEAKAYKKKFPKYKFVVAVKAFPSPRMSDGMAATYDQLLQVKEVDQVLVGEDEIIKFMNKPFYNKKLITNNKTQGDVMNNNTLIMDTILHGATIGNTDGVTKLVEMMSASKSKPSKSKPKKKSYNGKEATKRKKKHFLNTVVKGMASNQTQSIADINGDVLNVKPRSKRCMNRFFGSKLATSLEQMGAKMIDTGSEKKNADRYHFRISDIMSNVH